MAVVPWCDACDRFLSPSTVLPDGRCPSCGRAVDAGAAHTAAVRPAEAATEDEDEDLGPIPWHLKLLAAALAVYLGFRAWQGIEWVLGR
jgi:hypothetical protein